MLGQELFSLFFLEELAESFYYVTVVSVEKKSWNSAWIKSFWPHHLFFYLSSYQKPIDNEIELWSDKKQITAVHWDKANTDRTCSTFSNAFSKSVSILVENLFLAWVIINLMSIAKYKMSVFDCQKLIKLQGD